MEEKALKFAAYVIAGITVSMCIALPFFPKLRARMEDTWEARAAEAEYEENQVEMQTLEILNDGMPDIYNDGRLRIRLPEGVAGSSITVTNDYVTQKLLIDIPDVGASYFDNYPIVGSSNHIDTISYTMNKESAGKTIGTIELGLDRVYELDMEYDDEFYYFEFLTPKEVYDKVIVIDAGHGGRAPGAIKQGVMEKEIDLAIVLEFKAIMEEKGGNIGVYYTRTDDGNPTFEQRVQLANRSDADLFISIHNNSLGNGRMSSTKGTQVMYQDESEDSKKLAQICLEEVTSAIGSRRLGLIEGDSIYIIRNSKVPVALIEVGFLTNQEELDLLQTKEYQRQTAEGIYNAVLRALGEW